MSVKTTKIFDLNLFSGSSELIRQAVGGVFYDVGTGEISFDSAEFSPEDGIRPNQIESIQFSSIDKSTDRILPRVKYASRLFANSSYNFLSDKDWETFIIGGDYANNEYVGIYNESVYADHANASPLPYLPREIINVEDESPSLTLTTEYFKFYPRYQQEVNRQESELTIPNYYLLSGNILLANENVGSSVAQYTYPDLENYLTATYINETKTIDTSKENLIIPNPNGFNSTLTWWNALDLSSYTSGLVDSDLRRLFSRMPFGNKLIIERELAVSDTDFRTIIEDNNYTIKFLKLLKETFQGENGLSTTTVNFGVNTEAITSTGILTGSQQATRTLPFQVVDVPTMLLYAYKNPTSETNNITFITGSGDYSSQVDFAMDTDGFYRHENTNRSVSVLNGFIDKIAEKFDTSADGTIHPLQNFLDQANADKYHETVAFRIQKIGGQPTGDSRTQNTIQNIWFYNEDNIITYFDTQAKYNTEYTYKVFKYDLVQGYKYQMSDVVTTRQIAVTSSGDTNIYCLEFYDPSTGASAAPLLTDSVTNVTTETQPIVDAFLEISGTYSMRQSELDNTNNDISDIFDNSYDGLDAVYGYDRDFVNGFRGASVEELQASIADPTVIMLISTYFDLLELFNLQETNLGIIEEQYEAALVEYEEVLEVRALSIENTLTGSSQINTTYPYLSDFNITIEPSLKIIEVPLEEKSMRIVDHPPNDFVVTPHHLLDQSNRLAFYCKYDTFSMNAVTYPPVLNERDFLNRSAYLIGHDFNRISEQTQESVARPRFIEVYRTTVKPTSYEDFSGNLRTTIDLKEENGDIPTDHLFVERVRENTVYYYAFRALSENGVAGQMSPVFESELINDGGYVYGRFEQHSEEDLQVAKPKEPLMAFKKLINVVPNIRHLNFDLAGLNYDNPAATEIEQVSLGSSNVRDPLFSSDSNRYFKIRLTSKKTGRKLDINIGFKKEVRK